VEDDFPMALDETNHRLFRGLWKPPQLLVSNTETGRQVPAGKIARKTDDLFYDSARCRVSVRGARDTSRFSNRKMPTTMTGSPIIRLGRAGRRVLLVPEWEKLFVAVPAQRQIVKIPVPVTHRASTTEGGWK